jgi:hypothetical protein
VSIYQLSSLCQNKVKNDAKAFAAGNLTKKQDI